MTKKLLKLVMVLLVILMAAKTITWIIGCVGIFWMVIFMALIAFLVGLSAKEKNRYHKVNTDSKLPEVSETQAKEFVAKLRRKEEKEREEYYEKAEKREEDLLLENLKDVVNHLQKNREVWFAQQDILAVKALIRGKNKENLEKLFQLYKERRGTTTGVNPHIKAKEDCGELKIRYV